MRDIRGVRLVGVFAERQDPKSCDSASYLPFPRSRDGSDPIVHDNQDATETRGRATSCSRHGTHESDAPLPALRPEFVLQRLIANGSVPASARDDPENHLDEKHRVHRDVHAAFFLRVQSRGACAERGGHTVRLPKTGSLPAEPTSMRRRTRRRRPRFVCVFFSLFLHEHFDAMSRSRHGSVLCEQELLGARIPAGRTTLPLRVHAIDLEPLSH